MAHFCFDELAGIGVGRPVAVTSSWWGRRRSLSSTSSSISLWLEPASIGLRHSGASWESSVQERGDSRPYLAAEDSWGTTSHEQQDGNTAGTPGSCCGLGSIDRYRRDDQRHERLAVSLIVGCACSLSYLATDEKPILRTRSPDPESSTPMMALPEQNFRSNPYCESFYDPYDQPAGYEPVDAFSIMAPKPGPVIKFDKYLELMKTFYHRPAEKVKEKTAEPKRSHKPSSLRKDNSTSAQASAPLKPAAAPKPHRAQSTYEIPKAKRITCQPASPISYPVLEAEPSIAAGTEHLQDNDESIRAFSELAHKRLVFSPCSPSSSSADCSEKRAVLLTALIEPREDPPSHEHVEEEDVDVMLSEPRCRIDEARNPHGRTLRRTCFRKRKREEGDHSPGRPHPATLNSSLTNLLE